MVLPVYIPLVPILLVAEILGKVVILTPAVMKSWTLTEHFPFVQILPGVYSFFSHADFVSFVVVLVSSNYTWNSVI